MRTTTTALMASAALLAGFSVASAQTTSTQTTTSESAATGDTAFEGEVIALPEWHPDLAPETTMSVERLLDFDVVGPTGEDIGDVENILMGTEGEVLSVVAEVGGFLDIGDTHVNVPWDEVDVDLAAERITVPVTQETVEDYTLFTNEVVTAGQAQAGIDEVEGDGIGAVDTGPRVWRAAELINDYVRLQDGDAFVDYGYVDDVLIADGRIEAVVVRPDVTWGAPGLYGYPYYGYGYGWYPGDLYYDLPYARDDVAELEPLDEEVWDD